MQAGAGGCRWVQVVRAEVRGDGPQLTVDRCVVLSNSNGDCDGDRDGVVRVAVNDARGG